MSEQNQEPSTEVADLMNSIQEAKETIAEETGEIDKTTRKAGRPKGSKDKIPRKNKNVTSGPDPLPSMEESQPEVTPAMIMPMLEGAVKFPFDLLASKTGCEKLKLSEEEARPTITALDQFLKYYMPDMEKTDPKVLAAFTLMSSAAFLGYAKFMTYSEWKEEEAKKLSEKILPTEEKPQVPAQPRAPWEVIHANV